MKPKASTLHLEDSSKSKLHFNYDEPTAKEFYSASASIPVNLVQSEEKTLAKQTSAPSYLISLRENEAPPFQKPGKRERPHLLIGTIMNEGEAIEMIGAVESNRKRGLKIYMDDFLVRKNITPNFNLSERAFLSSLISEVIDYGARKDFNAFKLSTLITIYLSCHMQFKWYFWSAPSMVWDYFKEIMIRHTIEDSPFGQEVFEPDECYDILTQFHTIYLSNLPLIHILTFGVYRLKFTWPYKSKTA